VNNRGSVHIYEGKGKGKTTAAIGLSIRVAGAGKKVCFIQFLKPRQSSEIGILKRLGIKTVLFDQKHPLFYKSASVEKLLLQVQKDMITANAIVKDGKYDLIVLDEILYAFKQKLIRDKDLIGIIEAKPAKTELVLTGAKATKKIVELADYVSTINETKHPFKRGIKARRGIEY